MTRFQQKSIHFKESIQTAMEKNIANKQLARADSIPLRPPRHMLRAGIFFLATGTFTYTCAALYDYENAKKQFRSLLDQTFYEFRRIFYGLPPTRLDRSADRVIWSIICANVLIFVLWRIPKLQPRMWQYFTNSIASKSLCWPMLLSVFSHSYFFHLFFNMYVMQNFSIGAMGFLGPAQFLAMYLTGGVFGSLTSLCYKAAVKSTLPSLGASGAICTVIGYICSMAPDLRVHLIFLPIYDFTAQNALYGMLFFEMACLLRIIPLFGVLDNAAHLGGFFFGMFYARYGEEYYQRTFKPHAIRLWTALKGDGGQSPPSETPIMVYDGKRHKKMTMDKLEEGTENQKEEKKEKLRKHLEKSGGKWKDKQHQERHQQWEEQQREEREAQKERIRQNRAERERRRQTKEAGEEED